MAAAVSLAPPAPIINTKQMAAQPHSCPKCGTAVPPTLDARKAQQTIAELEAQVELLKEKATAAGMCSVRCDALRMQPCRQKDDRDLGANIFGQWIDVQTTRTSYEHTRIPEETMRVSPQQRGPQTKTSDRPPRARPPQEHRASPSSLPAVAHLPNSP